MSLIFEEAERGRSISRAERKEREPELRRGLLEVQSRLADCSEFPVLILFAGVDGAGKGELANRLTEWMDPRRITSHAYGEPTQEERERPEFWRFWRDLPPKGYIGTFLSAWYHAPLLERVYEDIDDDELEARLQRVLTFEQQLVADGALILKFWMHMGKDTQEACFRALESDPLQSWRVRPKDWKHWRMYDRFIPTAARLIELTSSDAAPWHVVEGADGNYRELTVGETILAALEARLPADAPATGAASPKKAPSDEI